MTHLGSVVSSNKVGFEVGLRVGWSISVGFNVGVKVGFLVGVGTSEDKHGLWTILFGVLDGSGSGVFS